jgi:hypothetical protein
MLDAMRQLLRITITIKLKDEDFIQHHFKVILTNGGYFWTYFHQYSQDLKLKIVRVASTTLEWLLIA